MTQRQEERFRRTLFNRRRRRNSLSLLWNPYHVANVLRPLSSDVSLPRSQEADPSSTFVYCIELPGFQCRTSSAQRELSIGQIGQLNGLNLSLFPGANSFNILPNHFAQPLPQYTMVKVGITSNLTHPAKRACVQHYERLERIWCL